MEEKELEEVPPKEEVVSKSDEKKKNIVSEAKEESSDSFWDRYKYIIFLALFILVGYLIYTYFVNNGGGEQFSLGSSFGGSVPNSYKPTEPFFSQDAPSMPSCNNSGIIPTAGKKTGVV